MGMRENVGAVVFGISGLVLQGCGASPSEDPAHLEQALSCSASARTVYTVSNNDSTKLMPAATNFCWLTKSGGNFDGVAGYSGIFVYPQSDGYYHLEGNGQGDVGEARCVPLSCFSGDGVNDVVWVSDQFGAIANAGNGSCDSWSTQAWWGDAATILEAHPGPGRTAGGGEAANVSLSSDPFSSSYVQANDCQEDNKPIYANGVSLFVGTPSGGKAAHYTGIPFSVSGNYTLNLGVHTDEAICFFTHISGKFRGGAEFERLYTSYESATGRYLWYAQSSYGSSGGHLNGQGRCYYYNQWDL
jgi:hypothetical protein